MERSNYPPHAQHPDGVVRNLLQQHGVSHHRLHHPGAVGNPATDIEASSPNAAHERTAAPHAGNSGTTQWRPGPRFPGNNEALPRVRRKSDWLPGSPGCAASNSDWSVPGVDSDPVHQAGRPDGPFTEAVPLDYLCSNPLCRPLERQLFVAETGRTGSFSHCAAHTGGRNHLRAAKDDNDPLSGSAPAIQSKHDAVDDSHFPGVLLPAVAQRSSPLLDCIQCYRRGHPVFHHRLGAVVPTDPQIGSGSKPADPVRRRRHGIRGE